MRILITGSSGFIGTNLIEFILRNNLGEVLNLDISPPLNSKHKPYWHYCDILSFDSLYNELSNFNPSAVIHLAAKTDTASSRISDYSVNYVGTANLIACINQLGLSDITFILASTQYVYKSNSTPLPSTQNEFAPHTAYGQSKSFAELLLSTSNAHFTWSIVRPTNIWGPWNYRYLRGLFKIMRSGLYFHPHNIYPIKSYGYVENVCHQIIQILAIDKSLVDRQVFYVGDPPVSSRSWLNKLSFAICGRNISEAPYFILLLAAKFGDLLLSLNLPAPLYSQRLANMIDSYPVPMDNTLSTLGLSSPDLKENISVTLDWCRQHGF